MILIHNVLWIGFNKCTLHNETMLCVRVMVLQVMKFYAVKWPFQHKQHEQCTLNTLQCGAIDALLLCFICKQINNNWHTLIQTNTPTTIHSCMCGQIQVTCHLQHREHFFFVRVTLKFFGHEPIFALFSSFYRVTWFVYRRYDCSHNKY